MSLIPVPLCLPAPLVNLPLAPHPLVAVSHLVPLVLAVLFRIALVVVHVVSISVAVTATVPISAQVLGKVFLKAGKYQLYTTMRKDEQQAEKWAVKAAFYL